MSFLSRFISQPQQPPPPTATDNATDGSDLSDPEKGTSAHRENGVPAHHVDPALEKQVVRKLDWRVPPLLAALYLLSFLDRSNVGNARIAGMEDDLDLIGDRYDWLLTIFYIAYIVFEFFGLAWKIVPPHIWASCVVFAWGLIATLQSVTTSWGGMMACRFFLGASEAAYGPGVPFLLSFFYLRHELGSRVGIFLSAAPLANTFAGALAYGITSGHAHIANWRLLFIVEGVPTCLIAVVTFFFLPDTPETARFFNEEERAVARARLVRQVGPGERISGINVKEFLVTFLDPKAWIQALMYFSCNVSFSSLPVFLPTILSDMGFSDIDSQGLTAPPYFLSFIIVIASCIIADRTRQRGLCIIVLSIVGGIGYIVLATQLSNGVRYFGVFLAAAGIFPAISNILAWVINNQGSDTKRGTGIVILNILGQCGPLLGTRLYPTSDSPRYEKGHYVCAAFMFFNALLAISLRTMLVWENKRKDRKYGVSPGGGTVADGLVDGEKRPPVEGEGTTTAAQAGTPAAVGVAEENEGPNFRYIL